MTVEFIVPVVELKGTVLVVFMMKDKKCVKGGQ